MLDREATKRRASAARPGHAAAELVFAGSRLAAPEMAKACCPFHAWNGHPGEPAGHNTARTPSPPRINATSSHTRAAGIPGTHAPSRLSPRPRACGSGASLVAGENPTLRTAGNSNLDALTAPPRPRQPSPLGPNATRPGHAWDCRASCGKPRARPAHGLSAVRFRGCLAMETSAKPPRGRGCCIEQTRSRAGG